MRKRPDGTIDYGADPEVQKELDRGRALEARQHLPAEKRSRAARQAEIDARRNRRNIDIDPDLEKSIEALAADLSVPFSQLLQRLAFEGMKTLTAEQLRAECQSSRSMRFANTLPLPSPKKGRKVSF